MGKSKKNLPKQKVNKQNVVIPKKPEVGSVIRLQEEGRSGRNILTHFVVTKVSKNGRFQGLELQLEFANEEECSVVLIRGKDIVYQPNTSYPKYVGVNPGIRKFFTREIVEDDSENRVIGQIVDDKALSRILDESLRG